MNSELNHTKNRLSNIWRDRDLGEVANVSARTRMNTVNEWAPPEGVEPKRELMFLSVGIPDSTSLPRESINTAMQQVMSSENDASLRYGFGQGYFPIRKYLAEKYSLERGLEVTDEWFQLTNGSSGAIDLVVRSLIDPGDVIIAESPTYMGTLSNFRGVQADIHPVSIDKEGLDVDELAETVRALKGAGKRVKLVYTISAFHNPTGATLSEERQERLLKLAAEEEFLILDDDAYGDLYYGSPPRTKLSGLSQGYGVITTGTFSKIVATGLRIGWVHAHPDFIQLFTRMRFDMGQNQMGLRMMGRFLEAGNLERHAVRVRALYKEKMNMAADALEHYAGDFLGFDRPLGGFYLWVKLAPGLSAREVWRTATREGVAVNPGYSFFSDKTEKNGEYLRIAFSWTPMDQLEEAVRRISVACRRVEAGDSV